MIKPTIGRVVWYYENNDQELPMPGIICFVHDDTLVNLAVFTEEGLHKAKLDVILCQEGDVEPASNYAEWMPFQKGQAAKTEQLEKELKQ